MKKFAKISVVLAAMALAFSFAGCSEGSSGGGSDSSEITGGETSGGETSGGETSGGETSGGETSGGETSGGSGEIPEGFVKVPGVINGSGIWAPESEVFVIGRKLEIKAFYMCDHEVTRGEYKEIMGSDPSYAKAYDKDGKLLTGDAANNNPVNMVSWYDAIVYCNRRSKNEGLTPCYKINGSTDPNNWGTIPTEGNDEKWDAATCNSKVNGYRLPTEAEWEWAARGGDVYAIYAGAAGSDTLTEVAWYIENTNDTGTREVKTKKANGYGLYDMSGNVYEWCWDWHSSISSSTPEEVASSGAIRVRRGGCWNYDDYFCGVAYRNRHNPARCDKALGFRVVRSAQ